MEKELEALRQEVAALRREIEALRGSIYPAQPQWITPFATPPTGWPLPFRPYSTCDAPTTAGAA